jgi:hypothetical protein
MRVLRLVGGVLALVVMTGCGSEGSAGGSSAPASADAAGGPSAGASSASSSASPSSPSAEASKRASSATKKALLPDSGFEEIGMKVDMAPKEDKWDWFESCRPYLPSEAKQVTGHHARWKGEGITVDQTVVAYPDGVAEDIVTEVRKTVTCTEYSAGQTQHTQVKAVTLPKDIAQPDTTHAWCLKSSNGGEVCYSVLAQQDLISSIWARADSRKEALDVLTVTTALAAKRIQVQIR